MTNNLSELNFASTIYLTMKNISKEDYLSVIYKNRDEKNEVKANLIADKMKISQAAVTDMLKKLSNEQLVKYEKYKSISLTKRGDEYARRVVRRHRIWEIFLHQIVGMPWEKVHDEAERLEHSSSDDLINRLEEMCNFPEFDPHGDPIPSKDGVVPSHKNPINLNSLPKGKSGKIVRVNDYDDSFLQYIRGIGVQLNKKIAVKEKRSFDNSLMVTIDGKDWNVSHKLAENIFVEVSSR